MKKKFILQVVAWLLTVAMLLPSANAALTTAYAEEGKAAHTGSVTFAASVDGTWAEKELTMKELLGTVAPDDVAYINFSCDAKVNVGYNPADHSSWKWVGFASSRDVTDMALDDWFACKLALNQNDGKQYTVTWSVYTGDVKTPEQEKEENLVSGPANVVHSDSVTFSDSTYWTNKELIGSASLIGDVNPDDVAYVKFTSDTEFFIGYNSTSNNNSYWQISDATDTWIADDINWAVTDYYLQLMLSKGDGVPYTIKWEVVSKIAATPTPTPSPSPTPSPTPVPKYTEVGETLTVTEDMVKDGVVTIKNAQYDEIIVPAGLGITKVTFNVVDIDKLVVTGGENYTVDFRNALVEEVEVAASDAKEMTYEELVAELAKAREAEDASAAVSAVVDKFIASQQAKSAAAAAQVKLVARDSEIDAITVKANADINVAEASVKELAVSTKDAVSRMEVKVTGFDGDASVDLDKGDRTYNAPLSLRFRESEVETLNVSGKEIFHVEGNNSTVDTMTVSDVVSVSTNLDADTLVVDEATKNADVRIYADVQNLAVDGEKNDIILPSCAEIENAYVAGDDICVYGLGSLNNAEVTGTGANVATLGTAVEGENDTTIPPAMIEMMPTAAPTPIATPIPLEGAAYAGSGMFYDGGNNYWNQYVVSQSDILGSVAPEDVDHITFTSEVNLVIGYNPIGDSGWTNTDSDGAKKVTVMGSDIEKFDSINVILRNETKKDQEVVWRVYTTPMTEEEEKEEVTNSITFSDSTGWSAVTPSLSDILGNIKPADVKSIEFSSTTEFSIGYKNKTGTTTVGDDPYFTKVEGKSSYVISADDIVLEKFEAPDGETKWYYMQIILQKNDGVEYTISWKINLKDSAGSGGDNEADADYVGDWGTGYKFDADAFADLTGEVTVALKYRTVSTATDYQIKAYERTNPWADIVPADYAKTDYAVNSKYNTMTLDKTEGTVSFTLTADAVERIKTNAKGIGIQVYNVIIEEATVTGANHTHSYESKVTKAATCVDEGVMTFTCECGDSYTEAIDATGHKWNADYTVDKAATCTENGSKSIHCSNCTETKNTTVIVATGHDYKDGVCDCGEKTEAATGGALITPTPLVTTLTVDGGYPGKQKSSNSIPASVFAQYTGDVISVTVNYVVTGDNNYPWLALVDLNNNWAKVPTSVDNSYGLVSASASESSVSFTINRSDIPTSTLAFQVDGLYVTSVTISGAGEEIADAAYVGNYAIGRKIFASELENFADMDIIVTVAYEKTQATVDYYQAALVNGSSGAEITGYTHASADSGTMEFNLSADLVNAIITDSSYLGVKANGLIIDAVSVQGKETLSAPETIYSGSTESGDWTTSLNIEGSKFADCAFDGTEVLIITYTSTDTTKWGTQFKLATTSNYTGLTDAENLSIASASVMKEVVLTEDFEVIVANGLQIQGFNWTITSVQVANRAQVYSGSIESGDWTTSLNIEGSEFADCAFDGTEVLVIAYTSTDTTKWGTQFKLATTSNYTGLTDAENLSIVSVSTIKEVVLTEAYEVIVTDGLQIQGFNWTITDVYVRLQ